MLTYREHIANANEYFANGAWAECVYSLLLALTDVEEDENWVLASALLAQIGHCGTKQACYTQANVAFHRAQMLLKRTNCRAEDLATLQRWTAESSANEQSKDELMRLNAQVEQLVAEDAVDEADELLARQYERGCALLGENNCSTAC